MINRINTNARMSQAVVHGNTVYLAGQVAKDGSADVSVQTSQILEKIDGLLKEVGSEKSKILSATIWLSDMSTFNEMNKVWDSWVPAGSAPARAAVEAALAAPEFKVEIAVVAAVG